MAELDCQAIQFEPTARVLLNPRGSSNPLPPSTNDCFRQPSAKFRRTCVRSSVSIGGGNFGCVRKTVEYQRILSIGELSLRRQFDFENQFSRRLAWVCEMRAEQNAHRPNGDRVLNQQRNVSFPTSSGGPSSLLRSASPVSRAMQLSSNGSAASSAKREERKLC